MSKTVRLRKGLDIRLIGAASKVRTEAQVPKTVSIRPADFHGMTPKMLLKEGEQVKIGDIVFQDKYSDTIKYASPVNGTLKAIVRGAKRKIEEIVISADATQDFDGGTPIDYASLSGEEVKSTMLAAGLWPFVRQRPLDVVADPKNEPKAIFVSAFDSSPLAPDFDFVVHGKEKEFQAGLDAISKLTTGKVHLTLNGKSPADATFKEAKGVQINTIVGKHPAGNVGTQIHHVDPINKGEFVWTLNAQDVEIIGRYFLTGKYNAKRTIALTGSEIKDPQYIDTIIGANVADILKGKITGDNVRVISGNVLTGNKIEQDGHLGFYHNQITVIPEGDQLKFFLTKGWLGPGFDKFSNSRLFPTFLIANKKFRLDTNLNGEERAFVVTGELDKVFPFDILPMQLVKAAITNDIDGMENLGIYEVAPEDFALCEYVCTSKIDIQDKIRQGLDVIAEECM
ncbi:Na(+)-translocating NADH-quinone reductase subunit A [Crocinitomicaceae bacterium]|nr:Na(+)-translocating NADH-quinone reductase subunit A [Crocinitomicaceae bacterium]MDC1384466.1 Na(+)-translocating NADH-quinone reductase subunit A [Crocinitomicaceae bacterium]